MEILKALLLSLPMTAITVALEYRFGCKTLGLRIPKVLAFGVMLMVQLLAGQLNMRFQLAPSGGASMLYYGAITLLLYLILFKGNIVKKLFFAMFIRCGIPTSYFVLLPFAGCFFEQGSENFIFALRILEYVNVALSIVLIEYAGKKFQNLRRELPTGYTLYLSVILLFAHMAVFSGYDVMLVRNAGIVPLPAALATSIFAIVGVGIVLIAVFAVDRQVDVSLKEQLTALQAENFKNRELERRKFSRFRHDIKNHLLCLNNLLESGKTEQAAAYMLNLTDTVKQLDSPVQTGNDYADALLSVKYAEAVDAGIKITLDMAIPAEGYIQPIDLCSILSNAFDNAIAACKQLAAQDRWITARAFVKQGQLVIEIRNSKPSHVNVMNGEVSPKEITADHGIGLDSVKSVVEQYGGTLDLTADNAFSFSVLLPPNHL